MPYNVSELAAYVDPPTPVPVPTLAGELDGAAGACVDADAAMGFATTSSAVADLLQLPLSQVGLPPGRPPQGLGLRGARAATALPAGAHLPREGPG